MLYLNTEKTMTNFAGKPIDFDLARNSCESCNEVFFTYFTGGAAGTDPNYCPYCGIKFTTKNGGPKDN